MTLCGTTGPSTYFSPSPSAAFLSLVALIPPTVVISFSAAAGSLSKSTVKAPLSLPLAASASGSQVSTFSSIRKPTWMAASWL